MEEFNRFSSYVPSDEQVNLIDSTLEVAFYASKSRHNRTVAADDSTLEEEEEQEEQEEDEQVIEEEEEQEEEAPDEEEEGLPSLPPADDDSHTDPRPELHSIQTEDDTEEGEGEGEEEGEETTSGTAENSHSRYSSEEVLGNDSDSDTEMDDMPALQKLQVVERPRAKSVDTKAHFQPPSTFRFSLAPGSLSPGSPSAAPGEQLQYRNSVVIARGQTRSRLTPEEMKQRTLSILSPTFTVGEEPEIKEHSKKYAVKLFTASDTSKRKFILDISPQGIRIRTKEKAFVRFFDMEMIESIRLRKLPSGEHIMDVDFLRPVPEDGSEQRYGRVIFLTDDGKAIIKDMNSYKSKTGSLMRPRRDSEKAEQKERDKLAKQQKELQREQEKEAKKEKKKKEKEMKRSKPPPPSSPPSSPLLLLLLLFSSSSFFFLFFPPPLPESRDPKEQLHLVFGVPLVKALEVGVTGGPALLDNVPAVVRECITYVDQHGLREEGIYRLSGSVAQIKVVRDRFDNGEVVSFEEAGFDAHCAASLLKQYLREMPETILTSKHDAQFLAVAGVQEGEERLQLLLSLLSELPPENYTLLSSLIDHLRKVEALSGENKMTLQNIGIVFVPTLKIPAQLFLLMLEQYDLIFSPGGAQPQ